ncbi:hypothetical protein [Saccharothrix hoggarensis]|uniref:DUF3558 domain-containing protein n=1 Tax=Saccharothrix hoggarensis TaxID=913853 RepID=A0ABW3QN16_9PSEU
MIKTVLAVALLALGACTSTPPTTEPSQTPPAPPATDSAGVSCDDAPEDVVGTALRLRLGRVSQTITGNVVRCAYDGGTAEVRFETGADAASFAEGRADHAGATDLPGFHDEAYRATAVTGEVVRTAVVARAGTVEITVLSGARTEHAQQLVTELFARL